MSERFNETLLWLLVINLGIAFGAGIYEGRIVVTEWITTAPDSVVHWNPEAARQSNTGLRFWVFVTTIPLTLITLANMAAAWRARGGMRTWWLGASVVALLDRVFTFSYFIPTMVGLMAVADSPDSAERAMQWVNLNYVRHLIVLAAWLSALKAFALLYQHRAANRLNERGA